MLNSIQIQIRLLSMKRTVYTFGISFEHNYIKHASKTKKWNRFTKIDLPSSDELGWIMIETGISNRSNNNDNHRQQKKEKRNRESPRAYHSRVLKLV